MGEDFLLVAGAGWSEIPDCQTLIDQTGLATMQGTIADQDWVGFLAYFTDTWTPDEGFELIDARIISEGVTNRVWVRVAAL